MKEEGVLWPKEHTSWRKGKYFVINQKMAINCKNTIVTMPANLSAHCCGDGASRHVLWLNTRTLTPGTLTATPHFPHLLTFHAHLNLDHAHLPTNTLHVTSSALKGIYPRYDQHKRTESHMRQKKRIRPRAQSLWSWVSLSILSSEQRRSQLDLVADATILDLREFAKNRQRVSC